MCRNELTGARINSKIPLHKPQTLEIRQRRQTRTPRRALVAGTVHILHARSGTRATRERHTDCETAGFRGASISSVPDRIDFCSPTPVPMLRCPVSWVCTEVHRNCSTVPSSFLTGSTKILRGSCPSPIAHDPYALCIMSAPLQEDMGALMWHTLA